MVVAFAVPFVTPSEGNGTGWGPPDNVVIDSKFTDLPYQPFGRSDRLGRAADFSSSNRNQTNYNNNNNNNRRGGGGGSGGRQNNNDDMGGGGMDNNDDDNERKFQLVDTAKAVTTKRFVNPASKRRQQSQRLRQINARRTQNNASGPGLDRMTAGRGRGIGGRLGGGGGGRGGRGGRSYYSQRADRQPSVAVQPDWQLLEEIDLAKLNKNLTTSTEVPTVEDIYLCGFLDHYNDSYDKVSARQPVSLKRIKHKEFYPVTTTDDPALENLAINGAGQIFITDAILSHLMTCTRSVYPWDIVVNKLQDGTLFFDKRDDSEFDLLSVQETAYAAPTEEDLPVKLAMEATMVNQNFSQQILKKGNRRELDMVNPFYDEADFPVEPASTAFRYRKFRLDETTTVVCRTELHGLVKKTQYMTAFALNEYQPIKALNVVNWREKMDSQLGAVLASELKNNSFKIAKWTAQSILASADQMKVGFVSRVHPKSAHDHVILATQFYRPTDFATQQGLQEGIMWSVFRMFVGLFAKQSAGKYVIMRNPNKAVIHLYKVALDEFEEEETSTK